LVLLSLIRQGSLHYIPTSYLIGFIVIFPTGIFTLHLYFLSHWFYCHNSDRDLYVLSHRLYCHNSDRDLYLLSHRFYCHNSDRNIYTTSLLIGLIVTYHIISHPSYHLPILRVLSYTNFSHRCYYLVSHALPNPNYMYSSIIIIKCRYHMTFRRNHSSSPLFFSGVRVAQSLVFYVVFCRSLFVRLSFFM
jgi:hypothetical protein